MALVPVTTYAAGWNPVTKQGRLFIQFTGATPQPVPVGSHDELQVLLLMLSKNGVMFDTSTKEIEIPFRPPGS